MSVGDECSELSDTKGMINIEDYDDTHKKTIPKFHNGCAQFNPR